MGDKMAKVIILEDKKEEGLAETIYFRREKGESIHEAFLRAAKKDANRREEKIMAEGMPYKILIWQRLKHDGGKCDVCDENKNIRIYKTDTGQKRFCSDCDKKDDAQLHGKDVTRL